MKQLYNAGSIPGEVSEPNPNLNCAEAQSRTESFDPDLNHAKEPSEGLLNSNDDDLGCTENELNLNSKDSEDDSDPKTSINAKFGNLQVADPKFTQDKAGY